MAVGCHRRERCRLCALRKAAGRCSRGPYRYSETSCLAAVPSGARQPKIGATPIRKPRSSARPGLWLGKGGHRGYQVAVCELPDWICTEGVLRLRCRPPLPAREGPTAAVKARRCLLRRVLLPRSAQPASRTQVAERVNAACIHGNKAVCSGALREAVRAGWSAVLV